MHLLHFSAPAACSKASPNTFYTVYESPLWWLFRAVGELKRILTGVYICEDIMT